MFREMFFYHGPKGYITGGVYAEYWRVEPPNPCRKYHISSAVTCGYLIAEIVLPILRSKKVHHKIVKDLPSLFRQTYGDIAVNAGKFITVYMNPEVDQNDLLRRINDDLQSEQGVMPGPKWPMLRLGRSGPEDTRIFETPVFSGPKGPFIFGGFVVDPRS